MAQTNMKLARVEPIVVNIWFIIGGIIVGLESELYCQLVDCVCVGEWHGNLSVAKGKAFSFSWLLFFDEEKRETVRLDFVKVGG